MGVSEEAKERRASEQVKEWRVSEQVKERGVSKQVKESRVNERAKGRRVRGRVKEKRARLRVGNFEISLVYCEEAAICTLPLIARRWVVLAEMSFSVHEMAPRPFWEAPWVANIIFGCGCKEGFHSSTFYFCLHFSTDSLTYFVETRPEQ